MQTVGGHARSLEVTGLNLIEALNFFRVLFPNWINWWTHGEDRAIACFNLTIVRDALNLHILN